MIQDLSKLRERAGWIRVADLLPPEGEVVETDTPSTGQVARLRRKGNLWFFEDYSMYVYYTPGYWRHLT